MSSGRRLYSSVGHRGFNEDRSCRTVGNRLQLVRGEELRPAVPVIRRAALDGGALGRVIKVNGMRCDSHDCGKPRRRRVGLLVRSTTSSSRHTRSTSLSVCLVQCWLQAHCAEQMPVFSGRGEATVQLLWPEPRRTSKTNHSQQQENLSGAAESRVAPRRLEAKSSNHSCPLLPSSN